MQNEPVLVVGAGPTGLTAALELARLGVAVRIVDKVPAPPADAPPPPERSRAIGVQARTLELMEQRGLAAEMVRRGHPTAGCSVYGDGERLFHVDFGRIESRYPYLLFLSQMETERILREAALALGVRVERGVELVGLAQDAPDGEPTSVAFVLRHAGGRLEEARTPWLVDAEGAHSVVRTTLDLPFEGRLLDETFALGDVRVDGDLPEDDFHLFSTEAGFMGLFPFGDRRFRIIATVAPGTAQRDAAPTVEGLQAIYDDRSPAPARFGDLRWSSWFHIHSRMVPVVRAGRVLLGGDAAHIHSPAGGQGMNTGIQDMINLAWKLALVIQGQAPEALLDTYQEERVPVMRRLLRMTEAITDVMSSRRPLVRRLLRDLAPHLGRTSRVQQLVPFRISQIAVGYRQSPLSESHGHAGRLRAGDRVPDVPVRSRAAHGDAWQDASLFGLLDPSRFTLLVVHPAGVDDVGEAFCEVARPWPVIRIAGIAPPSGDGASGGARFEATFGRSAGALLVRPDGYVGLVCGKRASGEHLDAYCRRWLIAPAQARAPEQRAA